ncbi:hypothetical protein [Metabacillus indicus]|uniref:hypothetical protein n=1 Tax=Metabacillus indicus TaxID=246786 RepID=UPI003CEEBB1A
MKQTGVLIISLSLLTFAVILTIAQSAQFNNWYENVHSVSYLLIVITLVTGLYMTFTSSKPK